MMRPRLMMQSREGTTSARGNTSLRSRSGVLPATIVSQQLPVFADDQVNRYMTELRSINLPVPPYDVDCLDKGAQSYTSLGRDRGLQTMRALKLEDFPPPMVSSHLDCTDESQFSDKEVTVFEEQLEENGGLDTHKSAQLLKRTPADVLRFSYIWKNGKLKEENEALRAHQRVSHSHARQNKTLGAPSLGRIRARASSSPLDDEVSLYNASFINSSKMQCAACSRKISSAWWRCPRTVPGVAMCEECGYVGPSESSLGPC